MTKSIGRNATTVTVLNVKDQLVIHGMDIFMRRIKC